MAEIGIDQSKLPGVKEVCRDFAVLEDHTLAHSLQEQEIEHHLATNVQRNRLVQGDLQIAKQLQEEEDRRARACIQEHHKDIERQDCEIAQEIQVKLVIEAEQLRRQEEDDEDIARVLQQKELQGEKKKRKPPTDPSRHGGYKESYYLDSRDRLSRSPPGQPSRSWSGDRQPLHHRDTRRGPPFVSEGLELEVLGSSSEGRKPKDGQRHHRERQRDKKPGRHEKPWKEVEGEALEGGSSRSRNGRAASEERPQRTSTLGQEAGHSSRERQRRRPRSRERPQSLVDWRDEEASRHCKHRERLSPSSEKSLRPPRLGAEEEEERRSRRPGSGSPSLGGHRPPAQEERQSPRPSSHDHRPRDLDTASQRSHRRPVERGEERGRVGEPSSSSSSRHGESRELDPRCSWQPGTKSRGTKEATFPKSRGVAVQDLESFDAEIARKLQEEELLANEADEKAAQVAQDEEIARLLMAEEKKAYKKAKEREKPSSEKKRQDQNWKHNTSESGGPRSREDHDPHRGRSDKPTRPPPPPTEELDHLVNLTSQQNSAYEVPKPEPSHRGYHYKP